MPYELPCPIGQMTTEQLLEYLSYFGVKDTEHCSRQYLDQVFKSKGIKVVWKPARFKVTITKRNSGEVIASHDPRDK